MYLLFLDPIADQSEDEINKRVNRVVVLFTPKPE
jgi:hypothetical protein